MQACRTSLSIIITVVNVRNPVWMPTPQWLTLLPERVPFGLGDFVNYTLGWSFADRDSLHDRLGDAVVIVGPAENEVIIRKIQKLVKTLRPG
jgi:hypothetical protein